MKRDDDHFGAVERGFRLGKLGLSVVGSYLGYQAQNIFMSEETREQRRTRFQQKASRRAREELGTLKGPAMKLGQIISMGTEALPEEALHELAQLQMRAPAMHPSLARAQFKAALGKYPEDVFREFDPEPFAAASLGQVHRAVTRNREKVAVKIQYPAIRSAIENDFKLLKSATLPARLTGHVPAALVEEIERGILEETDYVHEAENLEFFREGMRELEYLTIPRVYRDLSSDRVLTMSFVEGGSLAEFLKRKPAAALRDLVGTRLFEMYHLQLHKLNALHADHHPGNYLFLHDGRIGLVDFGCVKRMSVSCSELTRCYVQRSWRKGEKEARHFLEMMYGKHVPYSRARKVLPLIDRMADAFYPEEESEDRVIDYGDIESHAEYRKLGREHWNRIIRDKLINPEFAFMVRANFGVFHLLHDLRATVNISEVRRRVPDQPAIRRVEMRL